MSGDGEKQVLSADHVMIAAGSQSITLGKSLVGGEHCITSDNIFALEKLPKSMVIIGGGYIGTEIAGIMHAFGVKTTLIVKDVLLGRVDQEVVDLLIENMKKAGQTLKFNVDTTKVAKNPSSNMLNVHFSDGTSIEAEECLLALGRKPNTDGLGLKEVGIQLEPNGAVKVDEY